MLLVNVNHETYKSLELSEANRLKLEKGYHHGPTHNYRIRCKPYC